jgi:hypothetical protein
VSDRKTQTWFPRTVFAGAIVVTSAVAIGATPGPAAAQFYPTYSHQYDNPYHRHDGWVSGNSGWHRGWSDHGRGHGEGGHGDRDHAGEATMVIGAGAAVARVAGLPCTMEHAVPPVGLLATTSARLALITDSHG